MTTTKQVQFFHERAEQSIGFVFWQISNLWQRKIVQALKPTSLTHVQFVLLAVTGWHNQKGNIVTQAFLAEQAKTDIMMTSKVARTLEQKGLLRREEHKTDTRAFSLILTPLGIKKLNQAMPLVVEVDKQFFSVLKKEQNLFMIKMLELLREHEK